MTDAPKATDAAKTSSEAKPETAIPATTTKSSVSEVAVPNGEKDKAAVKSPKDDQAPGQEHENPEEADVEREVVKGNWNLPDVKLTVVQPETGEEGEEEVWCCRAKLYRWRQGEWKERGLGDAKMMKDEVGKVRFLLRQEKTGKVVANHYIIAKEGMCELTPNAGSDKIWVWKVLDSADDDAGPQVEQFGLKFGTVENATIFKNEFSKAVEANSSLF